MQNYEDESNRHGRGCPILLSVSVREGESGESLALKSVWDFCAWALGPLLSWAAWPGNIRVPPDASYYTLDVIQAFRRHGPCTEDSDPILNDTNGGDGRNPGRERRPVIYSYSSEPGAACSVQVRRLSKALGGCFWTWVGVVACE